MIRGRMCAALNPINTNFLRTQLDQLHSELQSTHRKANNARFRLIRLSEAADNLCRQAAKSLRMGRENDARDILIQKKKIMLALEKSKDRVELLDELATKLNEAISIKEAQLVENVASDLEIDVNDDGGPVHIVSPTPGSLKNLSDKINDDQESNTNGDVRVLESFGNTNIATVSSCIDFFNDVDRQLDTIEKDLSIISELPTLALKNEEKLGNTGVPQISEILDRVCDTRARIRNFVDQIEATI
ncbi:hypothetical protein RND81_11G082900 [Saponaria officinalis]|uniref:Uncharacterized protein n=1 Tax=Saponaria officinalis TaxID=3572 RepID=A0AAW1HIG3_SAPOF